MKQLIQYFWFLVGLMAVILCLISIICTKYMAEKKNYTPRQKRQYLLTWVLLLFIFLYFTITSLPK